MTHSIKWNKQGWHVVTTLGSLVLATILLDSYADALRAMAALSGGR